MASEDTLITYPGASTLTQRTGCPSSPTCRRRPASTRPSSTSRCGTSGRFSCSFSWPPLQPSVPAGRPVPDLPDPLPFWASSAPSARVRSVPTSPRWPTLHARWRRRAAWPCRPAPTCWASGARLNAENRLHGGFLPPMGLNSLGQVGRDRLFFSEVARLGVIFRKSLLVQYPSEPARCPAGPAIPEAGGERGSTAAR